LQNPTCKVETSLSSISYVEVDCDSHFNMFEDPVSRGIMRCYHMVNVVACKVCRINAWDLHNRVLCMPDCKMAYLFGWNN